MPLTGVHFLLSYQCSHECDHCFVWAAPPNWSVATTCQSTRGQSTPAICATRFDRDSDPGIRSAWDPDRCTA